MYKGNLSECKCDCKATKRRKLREQFNENKKKICNNCEINNKNDSKLKFGQVSKGSSSSDSIIAISNTSQVDDVQAQRFSYRQKLKPKTRATLLGLDENSSTALAKLSASVLVTTMYRKLNKTSNKLLIATVWPLVLLLLTLLVTTMTDLICQLNDDDDDAVVIKKTTTATNLIAALAAELTALMALRKLHKATTTKTTMMTTTPTLMATFFVLLTSSATLIGAATNDFEPQHVQPQRQLFAMLTKNGQQQAAAFGAMNFGGNGNGGGGGNAGVPGSFLRNLPSPRRNRHRSSDTAGNYDDETTSLETIGFVSDDGDQRYEKAEKALAAAAAAANAAATDNFSQNQLKTLSQPSNINCPKECKCLNDYFDCHKEHLDRVPTLPNYVQNVDLSFNNLNDTTILQIKNLPELKRLHLKRNQLDVMPKFEGLTNLKQLNLANNRIQQISNEALSVLPKLKSLDLSRNFLHSLEANCFPATNRLAHLILNFNKIASIDEHSLENLNGLLDLNLNSNRLTTLPAGVFKSLNKLEKLSLNHNHLEINWSTFKGLLSLKKLSLQSNNIRALQDGIFHVMRGIETIELDNNDITSLSRQGLFNLTKLHHLSLSNNTISRIELDTWEFTQSLIYLDLSYNNISEFKPQHLDCLQHLRVLNLGHNKIDFFADSTFDCVKNLEELYLKRNKLAWIIEDAGAMPPFKSLRKLRKLDLSGNNLKQINSKSLMGLANLEELYLENNALASIQNNAFEHMTHLKKVKLKSMNFICDCDLRWFQRWLLAKSNGTAKMQENAICGYPEHLFDRPLLTLKQNELICADSPKPVILTEPKNQLAVKGANITMECIANSPAAAALAASDELKIKWRHDNQNLRERNGGGNSLGSSTPAGPPQLHNSNHNQHHHHHGHGHHGNSYSYSTTETQILHDATTNQTTIIGYLRLFNVSYETAGRYQCVVSNAFGTTYSQKFKLSIGIHPSFLETPSNLTIDSGDTARLVCSATGDPTPEIALQKIGASDFPAATERRLIREENAFIITNAKAIDTGIYTCTAESAAGEIKVNASLVVNDKPIPSIPAVRKEVVLGTSGVLECLSELTADMQHAHREWFKDNKPFHTTTTSASERFYFTMEKEVLVIVNTQSMDAGNYRCEITDDSKTHALQTELIVVQEDFSHIVIMIGVGAFIVCFLIAALVVWIVLSCQRRKMYSNAGHRNAARVAAAANMNNRTLSGSRGSALDQTQLTTLNRTYLRAQQNEMRPRSLALDLEMNGGFAHHGAVANIDDAEQRNCLIVTSTPSYEEQVQMKIQRANTATPPRAAYDGSVDAYLRRNSLYDAEHQQDHLSSKDSGTGSDAAVKRSLEDFSTALLPSTNASNDATIVPTHGLGGRGCGGAGGQIINNAMRRDVYAAHHVCNGRNEVEHDNGDSDDEHTENISKTPTRPPCDSDVESIATSPVLGISDAVEMQVFRRNEHGTPHGQSTSSNSNCSSRYASNVTTPTRQSGFDGGGTFGTVVTPTLNMQHTKCKQDINQSFAASVATTQAVDI